MENFSLYDACALIGFIVVCFLFYRVGSFITFHLHPSGLSRYHHLPKDAAGVEKPWALITGASDGIGKGFAQELAARNFNIVLHGRNEKKLSNFQKELTSQFNVAVRILVIDVAACFSDNYEKDFERNVGDVVKDLNLTVLVNNIGGSAMEATAERAAVELDTIIDINVRFMTQLTRHLLPQLARNGPSLILNLSSSAGMIPSPYIATYSGCKAYISAFSRSLSTEMKMQGHDIEVKSLIVSKVITPGAGRDDSELSFMIPAARSVASSSLNKVGYESSVIIPHFAHALQLAFVGLVPESLLEKMLMPVFTAEREKLNKQG